MIVAGTETEMSEPSANSKNESRIEELLDRTRSLVRAMLESGFSASDISYSLAFIATELGLFVADPPLRVIPVVLSAISNASAVRANPKETERNATVESGIPDNTTVH